VPDANNPAAAHFREALELGGSDGDEVLYLAGNHYLRMAERLVNVQTQRAPTSLDSRLAAGCIFEAQGLYQFAAIQLLEAARMDPMNASIFLNLARNLLVVDLREAAGLAMERYRRLMPADAAAELNPAMLPHGRLLDIGGKTDFVGMLRGLPPVSEPLPPVPVLTAEVNSELRRKLPADRTGLWKTAVSSLCSGNFRGGLDTLSALGRSDDGWLRNYLEATVRTCLGDYEGTEHIAGLPAFARVALPFVQMLRAKSTSTSRSLTSTGC